MMMMMMMTMIAAKLFRVRSGPDWGSN